MFPLDQYTLSKDYELNREPVVAARAETHRLLAEAGLIVRPWLACQVCWSLWRLGRLLMDVGQRLEERYAPVTLNPALRVE